jgi:hypothetical protein
MQMNILTLDFIHSPLHSAVDPTREQDSLNFNPFDRSDGPPGRSHKDNGGTQSRNNIHASGGTPP